MGGLSFSQSRPEALIGDLGSGGAWPKHRQFATGGPESAAGECVVSGGLEFYRGVRGLEGCRSVVSGGLEEAQKAQRQ